MKLWTVIKNAFHFTNIIFSVQNDDCITFIRFLYYNIFVFKKDF